MIDYKSLLSRYRTFVSWREGTDFSNEIRSRQEDDTDCPVKFTEEELQVFEPKKNKCVFEKYERVLVRESRSAEWKPGLFLEMCEDDFITTAGSLWYYCRKWDESLIGKVTT